MRFCIGLKIESEVLLHNELHNPVFSIEFSPLFKETLDMVQVYRISIKHHTHPIIGRSNDHHSIMNLEGFIHFLRK